MELREIWRNFGATKVLQNVSLQVPEGSFTSLLGPSGCGKSTTLRIMSGLDRPTSGDVIMHGQNVEEFSAAERNIAMVFQSYALYPHFTVRQNIALPLAMRDLTRVERLPLARLFPGKARDKGAAIQVRVGEVADMLGLGQLLERKPAQLSGGQKQRVALARALVRDPVMFLLDEPLSNLDAKLRVQMRGELTDLHRKTGKPFVYVTHDQAEAMAMSDQIVVMIDGKVAQIGSPPALYDSPATLDVARFVGQNEMNVIDISKRHGQFAGWNIGPVVMGIRPEDLQPAADGKLSAKLERIEYLGVETLLHLRLEDGVSLRSLVSKGYEPPSVGSDIALDVPVGCLHLFDPETGGRIPERQLQAVV